MKKTVIIASLLATILFSACDQRDTIDVYETSSTPDLSNPIVQKLTNVTWYKNIGIHRLEKSLISSVRESGKSLQPRRILLSLTRKLPWDIST